MGPFSVLGLPETSTETEVKQAYKRLAILHHPDKAGTKSTAAFQTISCAYEEIISKELYHSNHCSQDQYWQSMFAQVSHVINEYTIAQKRSRVKDHYPESWAAHEDEQVRSELEELDKLNQEPDNGPLICLKISFILKHLRSIKIVDSKNYEEAEERGTWYIFETLLSEIGLDRLLFGETKALVKCIYESQLSFSVHELWQLAEGEIEERQSWKGCCEDLDENVGYVLG